MGVTLEEMLETCSDHGERSLLRWNRRRSKTDGTQQVEVRLGGDITDLLREFWAAAEQADKAEIETVRGNDTHRQQDMEGS